MKERILCVFDLEKPWAPAIMEALERKGYREGREISTCRSCADEIFGSSDLNQFVLLIIDPVMTGGRLDNEPGSLSVGIQIVKLLREIGYMVPIMAFAEVDSASFGELLDAGVDTVVDPKCATETIDKYVLGAIERLIRKGWALR